MNDVKLQTKDDYARVVCLFLAEGLRSRKVSLVRSAEIAQKVVENINLVDTEHDFLRLIKELAIDFQELLKLEDRIFLYVKNDERARMEKAVKDFAAAIMASDSKTALAIMQQALDEKTSIEMLKKNFPTFNEFLNAKNGYRKT